jgi:RHS repeat-associated protein
MRRIVAFALLVVTALCLGSPALATPHATAKSCGYAGGPSCPATPPTVGAWFYTPAQPFVDVVPPNGFYSVSEVGQWFQASYPTEPEGYCSQQLNYGGQDSNPPPAYFDGLLQHYYATITINQVWSTHLDPSCTYNGSVHEQYNASRSMYCPTPTNTVYQTNPTVGPYCVLPGGTPNPPKQAGPCCSKGGDSGSANSGAADSGSGGTVKGNPVDVANGNKFETETDYAGVGTSPIRFARTYNSLQGYLALLYSGQSPTQPLLGAAGWSATYFQYLLPVTVTDSTTTYNAVYAYRPDGRVLVFNLYNGVYSPDGDVADSLIQTVSGWQYQTADDTIETYNASGYLLSVAARGRAPVTVSYSSSLPDNVPASVSDPFGHTLQFSYLVDATNTQRLGSITDPNGATVVYGYDSNGRLSTVTYQDNTQHVYGYDTTQNRWLLASVTDEANVAYGSWTYQNYGAQVATSQHAGGVDLYQFSSSLSGSGGYVTVTDPLGQSRTYNQSLVWGRYRMTGSSTVCSGCGEDQFRVLDANGNITARTDFNGNETTYGYDLLDRLNSATSSSTSRGWTLDANGNRLTQTGSVTGTYTISTTNNRLNSISGSPSRSYTYDAAGDTLTYTGVTFTYYNNARMKTAKVGSSTTTYVYNALGQRIKKSGGSAGTVLMSYDESGHLLGEYSSTGALVQETVWMGDIPVATIRPNGSSVTVYYVHADHLNAPRMVTRTTDNKIAWRWDTDPFGTTAPNQNPQGLGTFTYNLRYPGQYFDSETGLSQNYFRDFDPQVGRYVESDPLLQFLSRFVSLPIFSNDLLLKAPQLLSSYAYVLDNPINFADPLGLCGIEPTGEKKPSLPSCPLPGPNEPLKPLPGMPNCSAACLAAQNEKVKACVQKCPGGATMIAVCSEEWRIRLPDCVANCP